MNTRIYAFVRPPFAGFTRVLMAALSFVLAACGPQDPSFTERTSEIQNSDEAKIEIPTANEEPKTDPTDPTDPTDRAVDPINPIIIVSGGTTGGTEGGTTGGSTTGGGTTSGGTTGSININTYQLTSDSFIQKSDSKVDILWIVDNSGSMREEQAYLGQNFTSFINKISTSNSDFQIGITSTDVCDTAPNSSIPMELRYCPGSEATSGIHHRGTLVGDTGKKVLKNSTTDLTSRFLRYTEIGTNGSSFEHGLSAAKMAISKSQAGQNEGLVRSDAFLAVIVVSDEEDDGLGLSRTDLYTGNNYFDLGLTSHKYTSDDFIRDAIAAKGAGKFSVSTITGTKNANGTLCTSPHSQPREEGSQYIAAAKKTGGVVHSICETNWSTSLANIGQDISAQSSQIVLTKTPYVPSIKVYVNGVLHNSWSYLAGSNAVKFNSGNIPATGANIKVEYRVIP